MRMSLILCESDMVVQYCRLKFQFREGLLRFSFKQYLRANIPVFRIIPLRGVVSVLWGLVSVLRCHWPFILKCEALVKSRVELVLISSNLKLHEISSKDGEGECNQDCVLELHFAVGMSPAQQGTVCDLPTTVLIPTTVLNDSLLLEMG